MNPNAPTSSIMAARPTITVLAVASDVRIAQHQQPPVIVGLRVDVPRCGECAANRLMYQPHQLVLRVPEELEETLRAKVKEGQLEGVELTSRESLKGIPDWASKGTMMELTMDGEKYPARLVNLPCVVEVQKTVDQVTLFKSGDVGQMVIVYMNEMELRKAVEQEKENIEKADKRAKASKGAVPASIHKDLYHSGLTPPTTNIVRRRFAETRLHGPYPPEMVSRVQNELAAHVMAIEERRQVPEVYEDIVDFEEWMADPSGQPISITEESPLWLDHPELMVHRPPEPPPVEPPPPSPSAHAAEDGKKAKGPPTGPKSTVKKAAGAKPGGTAKVDEPMEEVVVPQSEYGAELPPPPPSHRRGPGMRGPAPPLPPLPPAPEGPPPPSPPMYDVGDDDFLAFFDTMDDKEVLGPDDVLGDMGGGDA